MKYYWMTKSGVSTKYSGGYGRVSYEEGDMVSDYWLGAFGDNAARQAAIELDPEEYRKIIDDANSWDDFDPELFAGYLDCYGLDSDCYESYEDGLAAVDSLIAVEGTNAVHRWRKTGFVSWRFAGGIVKVNEDLDRLQVLFDEQPDEDKRYALKVNCFRWSPSEGAWQRKLNRKAVRAASRMTFLRMENGGDPMELQPKREEDRDLPRGW